MYFFETLMLCLHHYYVKCLMVCAVFCAIICFNVNAQKARVDSAAIHQDTVISKADYERLISKNYCPQTCNNQHYKFRRNIISLNVADYILQKYNLQYEYLATNEKWRIRGYTFFDVKDQNYGLAVNAYSNWRISKHVSHIIGGSLQGEYIGSFYQDFYLKFRPRGWAIDPAFATGLVFTAADRFVFGIDAAIGPGMVFRDNRFKGVFLDVRLGLTMGVKF